MQIGDDNFLSKKEEGFVDKQGRVFSERGAKEMEAMFKGDLGSLSACPYCDSTRGAYERVKVEGEQHWNFDGIPQEEGINKIDKIYTNDVRCMECQQSIPNDFFHKRYKNENFTTEPTDND